MALEEPHVYFCCCCLIDVLFCEIDDLKSYTKILLCTDFVVEKKTKNPIVIDNPPPIILYLYKYKPDPPYDFSLPPFINNDQSLKIIFFLLQLQHLTIVAC